MAKQGKINSNRDVQLKLDKISKGSKFTAISNRNITNLNSETATIGDIADYLVTLTKALQAKGLL